MVNIVRKRHQLVLYKNFVKDKISNKTRTWHIWMSFIQIGKIFLKEKIKNHFNFGQKCTLESDM